MEDEMKTLKEAWQVHEATVAVDRLLARARRTRTVEVLQRIGWVVVTIAAFALVAARMPMPPRPTAGNIWVAVGLCALVVGVAVRLRQGRELSYTSEAPDKMFRLLRRRREVELYWWTGTWPLLFAAAWLLAGVIIGFVTLSSPWAALGRVALIVAVAAAIAIVRVPRMRSEIASLQALERACASEPDESSGND